MRTVRLCLLAAACLISACRHTPAPQPAAGPTPEERLAAAGALVDAGCFDCLVQAFQQYSALISDTTVTARATESAIRTALLIAVRENEIGLLAGGYVERARVLAGDRPSPPVALMLDVADALSSVPAGNASSPVGDRETHAYLQISRRQDEWMTSLQAQVPGDLVASYLWLALACGPSRGTRLTTSERAGVLGESVERPLLAVKSESACVSSDHARIQGFLERDPRFNELHAVLGSIALRGLLPNGGLPDFEETDLEYRAAYAWRQDWPVLTMAMANLALASEDFERARDFFERTQVLVSAHPGARIGVVRALTYLTRHEEAIKAADVLIAETTTPGEARYWRAFNEFRLERNNEAWDDVELAALGLVNADIPKLAGLIAINRREFAVARQRLELARSRRRDCDTGYFLQSVLAELREWDPVVRVAAETAACFDGLDGILRRELTAVRTARMTDARRARQIAKVEQQIAANERMQATAWFNAAVGSFNLARKDAARDFAQRLVEDQQFGERARSLIDRLDAP
jgi:tetratricopeptide (TPR) repeat protein